jgi:hypothetical protein
MTRQATVRVVAVLVALVGLVFIGQGLGLIRNRSFMVDDIRWTVIGAGMVVGVMVALALDRARRR